MATHIRFCTNVRIVTTLNDTYLAYKPLTTVDAKQPTLALSRETRKITPYGLHNLLHSGRDTSQVPRPTTTSAYNTIGQRCAYT